MLELRRLGQCQCLDGACLLDQRAPTQTVDNCCCFGFVHPGHDVLLVERWNPTKGETAGQGWSANAADARRKDRHGARQGSLASLGASARTCGRPPSIGTLPVATRTRHLERAQGRPPRCGRPPAPIMAPRWRSGAGPSPCGLPQGSVARTRGVPPASPDIDRTVRPCRALVRTPPGERAPSCTVSARSRHRGAILLYARWPPEPACPGTT